MTEIIVSNPDHLIALSNEAVRLSCSKERLASIYRECCEARRTIEVVRGALTPEETEAATAAEAAWLAVVQFKEAVDAAHGLAGSEEAQVQVAALFTEQAERLVEWVKPRAWPLAKAAADVAAAQALGAKG